MTPCNTTASDEGLTLIHLDVELEPSWRSVITQTETRTGTTRHGCEQFAHSKSFMDLSQRPGADFIFSSEAGPPRHTDQTSVQMDCHTPPHLKLKVSPLFSPSLKRVHRIRGSKATRHSTAHSESLQGKNK
ncbi:hypothetical protein BGZ52_008251, partial [Haplosporangium bisporale]